MPNALGHARLGLAVPRRVVRLASGRNRLKRLMREIFRLHQAALPAMDLVARVRGGCPEAVFKAEFLDLLKRIGAHPVNRRSARASNE